jgi:hypothetical protein
MSINNLYKEVLVFLEIEKTTLQKRQKKKNTSYFWTLQRG